MRNDEKLTDRLLPCPFCGGKPDEDVFFCGLVRPGRYEVRCIPCNAVIRKADVGDRHVEY